MVLKSPEGWFYNSQFIIHNYFGGGVDFEILLMNNANGNAASIKTISKKVEKRSFSSAGLRLIFLVLF